MKRDINDPSSMGFYNKYEVNRRDGLDKECDKHFNCKYFVIDLTHDHFAIPAMKSYADACKDAYPNLYIDIQDWINNENCKKDI